MYKEMKPNDFFPESGSGPITPKTFTFSPLFSTSNFYVTDVVTSNKPSYTSSLID